MKKIPTIFERDWTGDRSRVTPQQNPNCDWVFAGEGVATQKYDGTSCLVRDGRLYKRREVKKGQVIPHDFEIADVDDETGKTVGWVPVGDGPEDRWHREAFKRESFDGWEPDAWVPGTYELVGPKVQGNPELFESHRLIAHADAAQLSGVPTGYEDLKVWLACFNIEGIVWHHPDGRMAKIKKRDFGLKR